MRIKDFFRKPRPTMILSSMCGGLVPGAMIAGKKYTDDILVQSCLNCIANEIGKLQPHHVRTSEKGETRVEYDEIERVLDRPNAMMTMFDLLSKTIWNLYSTANAFLLPVYNEYGKLSSLWPIPQANEISFDEHPDGTTFIVFDYAEQGKVKLRYDRIIHIRRNYSQNDYLGGDASGKANVKGLTEALKVQDYALNTVEKNFAISSGILGILQKKTKMAESSLIEAQESFRRVMESSNNGLVAMGNDIDYIPVDRKPVNMPPETAKFLEARILRYYGISTAILNGDYNKTQYAAFYQATLEPLCIALSQAFTKALFTIRESTSYGHKIKFYANETVFMEESQKFELVRLLGDHGGLMVNEIREMFGLQPLEELEGQRYQSLNYVEASIAKKYQLKGLDGDKPDENETESTNE